MPVSTPIPRIIWAYWNGDSVPLLIQRCFDNWARLNPGYSLRILNDAQLPQYVPQLPGNLQQLPVAKRSDWLRLELLHRHGGIWLDASTILTEPLDWLLEQQQRSGADLVAYYLERYTRDPQVPVVENWLMAAPPGSAFIAALHKEYVEQVLPQTGEAYIAQLQQAGEYEQLRQGIDMPAYLSMHLAMQRVLRAGGSYRLRLAKAEDGPFFLHVQGNWEPHPAQDPPDVLARRTGARAADQAARPRPQEAGLLSGARPLRARQHRRPIPAGLSGERALDHQPIAVSCR